MEWHRELSSSCDLWETVSSPGEGKKAGGEVRGEMGEWEEWFRKNRGMGVG